MNRQPLIGNNGEIRELTSKDFKNMRPASKVLPKELLSVLPRKGRPPKSNPKKSTTIRLDAEVLEFFKSQGKGWQTKVNDILHKYVDTHRAA